MSTEFGDLLNGRYQLERRLGAGGMGEVYRAFDTLHQRRCAVKRFRLEQMLTEQQTHPREPESARRSSKANRTSPFTRERAIGMFRAEAQLLAKLRHPNLPDFLRSNAG